MMADLIRRQDVIDMLTQAHVRAARKRDLQPGHHKNWHYWDGCDDGLLDALDVLTGFCSPAVAISSFKPKEPT